MTIVSPPSAPAARPAPPGPAGRQALGTALRWGIPLVLGLAVAVTPRPHEVTPNGWHLLAIFVATVAGVIARPLPMGAVAVLGLTVAGFTHVLTPDQALSGYANTAIWLIVLAFFIARGFVKTGLGTRIAYLFVRRFGHRTLGLAYSLAATDLILAPATPSNTARGGGIVFPIVRSLSTAFGSSPEDGTQGRIGSFLTLAAFQVNAITSAMFVTAMAANPIAVDLAKSAGVDLSWTKWALAALVPGLLCLVIVPLVIYRLQRPEITATPEAAEIADAKLKELGPVSRPEWAMIATFGLLLFCWTVGDQVWHWNATMSALAGLSMLLITRVLDWDDIKGETSAWDTLVWFGALVTMATFLAKFGVVKWFSGNMGHLTGGLSWPVALVVLIAIYLYSHYFFASNTAHVTAMYAAFLATAIAAGAPPVLAALGLGAASNLMGGLTHYSSGPAPVMYSPGYTTIGAWWKTGFAVSLVTLTIFTVAGAAWTKVLGLW